MPKRAFGPLMLPFKRRRRKIHDSSVTSSDSDVRTNYELSAAYVEDALAGRLYNSGLAQNLATGRTVAVWCLHLTSHPIYLPFLFLVVGFHCFLSSQEPVQMVRHPSPIINNMSFWGGIACCLTYIADVLLSLVYCRPKLYFTFTHNKLYALSIFLVTSDYILMASCGRMIFRGLRSFILIFRIQALRNTGLVMLAVTPKFLQFLLIMFAYVTVFAVMGVHLFVYTYVDNDVVQSQHDGIYQGAFNNIGISILEIFVLMAGGSYPRFMIPAYVKHGSPVLLYFITIIMTGEIMLYAILVARIYDFYVDANIHNVKEERHRERLCLLKAFEILDQEGTGNVPYNHWKGLIKALRPKATLSEIQKRFRKLKELSAKDRSGDVNTDQHWTFNLYEIFYLPSVLQFIVEKTKARRSVKSDSSDRQIFCDCLNYIGERFAALCRRWYNTRWAFAVSLALNILFLAPFAIVWYGMSQRVSRIVYITEMTLLTIMAFGVFMQFVALGVSYMIHQMSLHVLMLLVAIVCMIYVGSTHLESWTHGWLPVIAELAMVVRLTGFKRKSSSMFHWLRRLAPALLTLLCVTCIAFYSYGILGMECFGSLDSEHHLPTGISLCRYGFETLGCSLLTLFQISLGSSWHKVMHFIMAEISSWTCVYFVFFYAFMQMLVLNVISAIVVELSNKISRDETEAKQRDKQHETRDDVTRHTDSNTLGFLSFATSTSSRKRTSSSSTSAVMNSISATASLMTFNPVSSPPLDETNGSASLGTHEEQASSRKASRVSTTHPSKLPCIAEEDGIIEEVEEDDVTLTGRKQHGKFTHEILPEITFLNAAEFARIREEMGRSAERMKINKRRVR